MIRSDINIAKNIMDYGAALYYIVTRADGEILNWWKYYGVFPRNLPADSYSHTVGSPSQTELNVTFQYSIVSKGMDMNVLGELNILSNNYSRAKHIKHDFDKKHDTFGDPYVDAPYIYRETSTSDKKLYLGWKGASR